MTVFGAVSSAAPIASGTSQITEAVNLQEAANNLLQNVKVSDVHVSPLNVNRRQASPAAQLVDIEDVLEDPLQKVEVSGVDVEVLNVNHPVAKREEPQSIPAILLQAKAKLEATASELNDIVKAKVELNIDDVKVILDEVHDALLAAAASVKATVGQSATFILTHKGKTWTAAEVGSLLISVVVNVLYIVSLVLQVVVDASRTAASAQVTVVVDVMADLLQTIFVDLQVGIFAATRPHITEALFKFLSSLNLDVLVKVLQNGRL
ncbi:hypothetical protein C0992_007388 [Termitomyces sp. T32_za158]|nr:hypothetical protein C0992_007388 [Termitomyces sp. T32_za158]